MFYATIQQMKKSLRNLDAILEKGASHAETKKFAPEGFLLARLAPDMFTLTRQVQAACDAAKFAGARLTGKTPPVNPDTETSFAELRARVAATLAFLDTLTEADFAGAAERVVPLGFMPGKGLRGADYFLELSVPNFYFHVTTAYDLLRHNGVELGKRDFLGVLSLIDT